MITEEFSVGPNPELDVHIKSGRVEVKPGPEGKIRVEVDTGDPNFVVDQRGDLIFIGSEGDSSWVSRGTAYVVVETPEGTDVTVGTASAKVECNVAVGRCDVKTASGDVVFDRVGSAYVKTASGDAILKSVDGDIKISSASGDAQIADSTGKVSFSSASGDLKLGRCGGPLAVSTASGDIDVDHFSGRRATFKSMSGSVEIGIPSGSKVELDATLLSGKLDVIPSGRDDRTPSGIETTVNAKLVSGDLTIRGI